MSASTLLLGILFGSIGTGFFIYGKKQSSWMPMLCGIALMVIPYLITNVLLMCLAGIVLAILPFVVRI